MREQSAVCSGLEGRKLVNILNHIKIVKVILVVCKTALKCGIPRKGLDQSESGFEGASDSKFSFNNATEDG